MTPEEIEAAIAARVAAEVAKALANNAKKAAEEEPDDSDEFATIDDPKIKQLNLESKKHRQKAAAYKADKEVIQIELNELKAEKAREEEAKLLKNKQAEEALERNKTESRDKIAKFQQKAVSDELKLAITEEGLDPRFLTMIDRTGIKVDEEGNVSGVDFAVAQFKKQNGDLIETYIAGKKAKETPAQGAGDAGSETTTTQTGGMFKNPLTGKPYEKGVQIANAGATPAAAGKVTQKPFDARKATKAEADEYYRNMKTGLAKGR